MNLWKSLPDYPTKEDVKYEILSYLFKEENAREHFSFSTLNSIYGNEWEKSRFKELIEEMILTGDIEKIEKTTGGKDWYIIKDNVYK